MIRRDLLVVGAGPAGLFCALEAARRGLSVMVLDRQAKAGLKLSLAGGGMGNVTNLDISPRHYVGDQPEFCGKILARFGTKQVLALLSSLGIPWEEREFGQIFCLEPAIRLAEGLERLCREAGVKFCFHTEVQKVTPPSASETSHTAPASIRPAETAAPSTHDFLIHSSQGLFAAPRLALATGSPAFPQAGADGLGARLARSLGHAVTEFRPALVPLAMPPDWPLHGLEGISLPASLSVRKKDGSTRMDPCGARALLFTHQGISGPAVLVASCFWAPGETLLIDFLPDHPVLELLHEPAHGKLLVKNLLTRRLPARLAERLVPPALADRKAAEIGKKDRLLLADVLHRHAVIPSGTLGFKKAEAAAGGVATSSLTPALQSRLVPSLYILGELVDVTGLLGGYNIHWAFASAHAAARGMQPA